MAIVFISPLKQQKIFFWSIGIMLILFLIIIFSIVFVPGFFKKDQYVPGITKDMPFFNDANIALNFDIIDTDMVRNLEPFTQLETEFIYVVKDKKDKEIQGNISAVSEDNAKKLLEDADFKVVSLEEMKPGRSNPFIPYE